MADLPVESSVATRSGLDELVAHLRDAGRFAFDTEFVSEETFEPVLCLVQVATRDRLAIVDPLAVRDLSPFWDVVLDPEVELVMHAASEDLRICRFQTGKVPSHVFDVQIAAGLVGFGYPLSLGNLVNQALRISLSGGETRTDWRRRPLSESQLRYALDDVRHLLDLAERLEAQLDRLGRRSWAESEFAEFVDAIQNRSEEERWRRLPGLHQLNRRGLEVARRLSDWRNEEVAARIARSANRSATTCSWPSPSASPRTVATWRRSATSTVPTCWPKGARSWPSSPRRRPSPPSSCPSPPSVTRKGPA